MIFGEEFKKKRKLKGLNFDLNENLKEYMVKEVEKRYIELS